MSWTEDDRTNNIELAAGDLAATTTQWAEIHRLSTRNDWKKGLTREQADELISILKGVSFEDETDDVEFDDDRMLLPSEDADDDFDFYGEVA